MARVASTRSHKIEFRENFSAAALPFPLPLLSCHVVAFNPRLPPPASLNLLAPTMQYPVPHPAPPLAQAMPLMRLKSTLSGRCGRQAALDADPGAVSFLAQEASAGVPFLAACAGKVYFEVLCEGCEGGINVGLAGTNFRGTNVSGCAASWSVYSDGSTYHRSAAAMRARQPPPRYLSADAHLAAAMKGARWRRAGSRRARRWGWRWTSTPAPCASPSTAATGPSPSPTAALLPPPLAPPSSPR